MRVIPVIDLLDEVVVHGVGRDREKYEPIESVLTDSVEPLSVASEFEDIGFDELYIADLNSIQDNGNNVELIDQITSKTDLDVMVDAGFRGSQDIEPYVESGIDRVILATETLDSLAVVEEVRGKYGLKIVASVDVRGREIVAQSSELQRPFPELIREFEENGASEMILLNLEKVGSSAGPDTELVKRGLRHVDIPVFAGGGVRNVRDLIDLREIGGAGALVATALHSGSISVEDLDEL